MGIIDVKKLQGLIKKNKAINWYYKCLYALQEDIHKMWNPPGYSSGYKIKLKDK